VVEPPQQLAKCCHNTLGAKAESSGYRLVCPGRDLTRPAACGRRWAQSGERSEGAQRPQLNPHGLSAGIVTGRRVYRFHLARARWR
jgi:hypothetical protein